MLILFQKLPQFGDVHIHAPSVEIGVTAPYLLECDLTLQQVVLVFCEQFEEFVLFRGECARFTIDGQFAEFRIEMKPAQLENHIDILSVQFLVSFQVRLDLHEQYVAVEWLCDIVVGAEFVPLQDIILHGLRRDEEEGDVRIDVTDLLCEFESVHIGHHHIKQTEVEFLSLECCQAQSPITLQDNFVIIYLKVILEYHPEVGIVFA